MHTYIVTPVSCPPGIGLLFPAIRSPLGFTMDMSQQYGDIIPFHIMGHQTVMLNHPDLIHHALVENHKNFQKSKSYIRFESAVGLGLLTSNGNKWKRDRQKIQPMFNRERITKFYFSLVTDVVGKYKEKWLELTANGSADINITEEMAKITTEVILKSIFGQNITDHTVEKLHHSFSVLIDYLRSIRVFPHVDMRRKLYMPAYWTFKKELNNAEAHIRELTELYRNTNQDDQYNMLALLVKAQRENPEDFSDHDIRDHCMTMVFAGFESTSILMQWFWYALDERADITKKLCDEISGNDISSYEAISKLSYLDMTLKEAMRLYPPFWITEREAIENDRLGDFVLQKGTTVVIPQLAMHRHPKWWDEPNSFIPERFSPENEANIPDGAYIPFSLGPRKCSGHMFVDMEAKTIIATLLPHFEVLALNKVGNKMVPGISLKLEKPLYARISRRS